VRSKRFSLTHIAPSDGRWLEHALGAFRWFSLESAFLKESFLSQCECAVEVLCPRALEPPLTCINRTISWRNSADFFIGDFVNFKKDKNPFWQHPFLTSDPHRSGSRVF
jgi:hypothetical protein